MNTVWTPEDEKRFKELDARRTALQSNAVQAVRNFSETLFKADAGSRIELLTEKADGVIAALAPFSGRRKWNRVAFTFKSIRIWKSADGTCNITFTFANGRCTTIALLGESREIPARGVVFQDDAP